VSTELSLSRDRYLVVKIPALENALSASTDVGGTVNNYTSTFSKQEPRFPVLSNNAISALIAFISRYRPIVSQEWKKAVATCSMVAGGLRSVAVSV